MFPAWKVDNPSLLLNVLQYPPSPSKLAAMHLSQLQTSNFKLQTLLLLSFFLFQCADTSKNSHTANSENTAAADEQAARRAAATIKPDKFSVRPPFDNTQVNVAPSIHIVQPGQSTTLTLQTGTTIEIPANIFVNEAGQPVTTPVEIKFREFHNAAQIIASGIPMTVRGPNGQEDWMQTAGMFEIEGRSEGKPVKIAPGQSVAVHLASQVSGNYPVWYFDPAQGNWLEQGSNTPKANPAAAPLVREVAALRSATARRPVPPVEYDKSKPSLDFKLDVREFPELRPLRNIVWQYAGTDPKLDPANNRWINKTAWVEAKLESDKTSNRYLLTLVGDEKDYSIPVMPSLRGNDLEQAKATYDKAVARYEENMKALENKEAILNEQAAFRRSLSVKGFGIYNYDLLLHRSDALAVVADFDFGDLPFEAKKLVTVYLITGEGRTIIGLPFYNWSDFSYIPSKDNRLVAVLPGNRIATFSQQDFDNEEANLAAARNNRYVFKMKVEDAPITSEDDLQQRLLGPGSSGKKVGRLTLNKVFPNPLRDAMTITLTSPKDQVGRIRLLTSAGATLMDEDVKLVKGDNQFNYNLPNGITAGMYSVVATGADGQNASRQVAKQ